MNNYKFTAEDIIKWIEAKADIVEDGNYFPAYEEPELRLSIPKDKWDKLVAKVRCNE